MLKSLKSYTNNIHALNILFQPIFSLEHKIDGSLQGKKERKTA